MTTPLTPRQLDVLRLTAEGLTGDEIAARLHISIDSVKTHSKAFRRKLGARNSAHAVAIGYEQRIIVSRQLNSARAWAVHLEQELTHLRERLIRAGCLRPDATDDDLVRLVRDMGIVRDAEYRAVDRYAERAEALEERNATLSSLLRGMARRVGRDRRWRKQRFEDLQEEHQRAVESWDRQRERLTRYAQPVRDLHELPGAS